MTALSYPLFSFLVDRYVSSTISRLASLTSSSLHFTFFYGHRLFLVVQFYKHSSMPLRCNLFLLPWLLLVPDYVHFIITWYSACLILGLFFFSWSHLFAVSSSQTMIFYDPMPPIHLSDIKPCLFKLDLMINTLELTNNSVPHCISACTNSSSMLNDVATQTKNLMPAVASAIQPTKQNSLHFPWISMTWHFTTCHRWILH